MMVRYRPISDHFAEMPNRVLRGTLVKRRDYEGLKLLIRVHWRLYNGLTQVYDHGGRPVADSADVKALYLLMGMISRLTADTALDAVGLN